MNDNNTSRPKHPVGAARPFPRRCRHCGKNEVRLATIAYDAEVRHDGRLHQFKIAELHAPVCRACKKMVVTEAVDDQLNAALRTHLSYLAPAEIRAGLTRVGLTQKDAADCLGIAEATLSRWLNESQIQSRAMDNLLRTFFAFPQVRSALQARPHDPHFGTTDALG